MMITWVHGSLSNHVNGVCSIRAQENVEHAKIEVTTRHYSMRVGF